MTPTSPFPLGPRATTSDALVALLAQSYALGTVERVADLGGAYNLNLRLTTARGDYVARVYRPWVTPLRLAALQRLRQELAARGIPVIPPVPTATGEPLVRVGERVAEVEPFVPHPPAEETWERYTLLVSVLARLHAALRTCDGAPLPPPVVQNTASPDELRQWVSDAATRIAHGAHPQADAALAVCVEATRLLLKIGPWWEEHGRALPQQLVHGDYGTGNVLVADDRVVAVVDWDFAASHPRIFDLAYLLFWMFERLEPAIEPARRGWYRLPPLLAAYNAARGQPLTPAERRALRWELARVPLYWVGEAAFLPDPTAAVLASAPHVATAAWMLGDGSSIVDDALGTP
jgi:Ser/Thr protein kinase RdoA (MazF antagonist)